MAEWVWVQGYLLGWGFTPKLRPRGGGKSSNKATIPTSYLGLPEVGEVGTTIDRCIKSSALIGVMWDLLYGLTADQVAAHCLRIDPVKSLYLINFNNTFVPSTCTAALELCTIQSCVPDGVPYDRLLTGA